MHISEGVLSPAILTGGAALTAIGVGIGLKSIDYEEIPYMGILTAGFFVASLIHIPIGPASVHLILNGMLGLFLGWRVFPAILVGLALQALLFQFGGITTLGINTLNMAFPAVICYYLFGWGVKKNSGRLVFIITAFAAGCCAVLFAGILVGLSLYLNGDAFLPAAKLLVAAHLPVMLIEGVLTATCALFLRKVKPDILEGYYV
ncbi:MAG: cobalt transporter CbiM [Deltaproteobacteria bacterium]|nr:cobalt transporter CbiM [Deltaproteobacteria bacterium]